MITNLSGPYDVPRFHSHPFLATIPFRMILCVVGLLYFSMTLFAQDRKGGSPLDDTAGFIHLSPSFQSQLAYNPFNIVMQATVTDARVFSTRLYYDHLNYELLSVMPGPFVSLHVLPQDTVADTIKVDGFFHPNFTGTTTIATLTLLKRTLVDDDLTIVGFIDGQGYSGTADLPGPIELDGDTAYVDLEGTPPLPPTELILTLQYIPASGVVDSVLLQWNRVFYDLEGDTIINPLYIIGLEDVLNDPGEHDSVGSTSDTFYYHDFVKYYYFPFDSGVVNVGSYQITTKRTQP
jgi:hypothetical protein